MQPTPTRPQRLPLPTACRQIFKEKKPATFLAEFSSENQLNFTVLSAHLQQWRAQAAQWNLALAERINVRLENSDFATS